MSLFNKIFGGSDTSQQSYIAPQQLPYLTGLWRGAQGYLPQAQGLTQQFQPMANQLGQNAATGSNILTQLAGQDSTGGQIDVLQNRLNQNLTENLLPALAQGANVTGQLGGARQGIGQGLAVRGTQQALGEGTQGILSDDLYRRASAASAATGLAGTGIGALSGAAGLGFSPFAQLGQIIGPPTVLGQSQSTGYGKGIFGSLFPNGLFASGSIFK